MENFGNSIKKRIAKARPLIPELTHQLTIPRTKPKSKFRKQMQFAVNQISKAIVNHPNAGGLVPEKLKVFYSFSSELPPNGPNWIEFHIPGGGFYKIMNSLDSLMKAWKLFKREPERYPPKFPPPLPSGKEKDWSLENYQVRND